MSAFTVTAGTPMRGRLQVPGDKSISHRALLLAALAEGTSVVRGRCAGDDVERTARVIEALGAVVDGERITGGRSRLHEPAVVLDVGNAGTGIRLLAGFCSGLSGFFVLAGDASIAQRPMGRVVDPLRSMGAVIDGRDGGRYPPLAIRGGGLVGIDYQLPVASAQVKSAILLAGLSAEGETVVREAVLTRSHTEELLVGCGAEVATVTTGDGGHVVRLRASKLEAFTLDVPGDPSQAAFFVVAACIVAGSDLTIERVYVGPTRSAFCDVLRRMGADLEVDQATGTIRARASHLVATEVGGSEVPALIDEIPVLAVAAAVAEGTTVFRDAAELRVKETDRVATVAAGLRALGVDVEPRPDGMVVHGRPGGLRGARVWSHGDHRVAMAMAVAGLAAEGETTVEGWEAVATSYPGFEEDLKACGS